MSMQYPTITLKKETGSIHVYDGEVITVWLCEGKSYEPHLASNKMFQVELRMNPYTKKPEVFVVDDVQIKNFKEYTIPQEKGLQQ